MYEYVNVVSFIFFNHGYRAQGWGALMRNLQNRPNVLLGRVFFRTDMAGLEKCCTGGYGRNGAYRVKFDKDMRPPAKGPNEGSQRAISTLTSNFLRFCQLHCLYHIPNVSYSNVKDLDARNQC